MNAKQDIRNIFLDAIGYLENSYKGSSLTDIFVLVDEENGELSVFDDEQNCVAKNVVGHWLHHQYDDKIDYVADIKEVVVEMKNLFTSLDLYTPFSINYADEDFIVLEELLSIEDDSVIRLETDFMDRMDKEFDDFLDKLLKD